MNIHEYQAKQILKKYGAIIPEGVVGLTVKELLEAQGFAVDHSLLFIEHALQELEENKPTIH